MAVNTIIPIKQAQIKAVFRSNALCLSDVDRVSVAGTRGCNDLARGHLGDVMITMRYGKLQPFIFPVQLGQRLNKPHSDHRRAALRFFVTRDSAR